MQFSNSILRNKLNKIQTSVDNISSGSVDPNTALIKAKTDNLPVDPASITSVEAVQSTILGGAILTAVAGTASPGSWRNYRVGDILTLDGGFNGTIEVLAVEGLGEIISATPNNPGINYQVDDVLTVIWPANTGATLRVAGIDGNGGITSVEVLTGGTHYYDAAVSTEGGFTGGSGSGASVNIHCNPDGNITDFILRKSGWGYTTIENQSVSVTPNGGVNANFTITCTPIVETKQDLAIIKSAVAGAGIKTVTVHTGGSDYMVGQFLTLAGGVNGIVEVTGINDPEMSGWGGVSSVVIRQAGNGYSIGNNVASKNSAGGNDNATFNITALTTPAAQEGNATANKQEILNAVNAISITGSNPNGGNVELATVNYEAVLYDKFAAYEIALPGSIFNLPNSLIEPFNSYTVSLFWANYALVVNAINDNIFALANAGAPYNAGFINPAHLKFIAHFEGTGVIPSTVEADQPIYNGNTDAVGKAIITSWGLVTPPEALVGGSASATSEHLTDVAANAFDNDVDTFWANAAPTVLPTPSGIASDSENDGSAINAFDGNPATSWVAQHTVSLAGGFCPLDTQVPTDIGPVEGLNIQKQWQVDFQGSGHMTLFGSLDNNSWDQLGVTPDNTGTYTVDLPGTTAYQYYAIVANNQAKSGVSSILISNPLDNAPVIIEYDLGDSLGFAATYYSFDSTNNMPTDWALEGSNDNLVWTPLDTVSSYAGSFPYTNTFVNIVSYRYYHVKITAAPGITQVNELRVSTSAPAYLIANPQVLKYNIGVAKNIRQYSIESANNLPTDWTFEGSVNGTDWDILETVSGYVGGFPYTNTVVNNVAYNYVRLNITAANGNDDFVKINEFKASDSAVAAEYDTSDKVFGSSSASLKYSFGAGSVTQSVEHLQLLDKDWRFSGFFKFASGASFPQTLFTITGKELEIQATSSGLRINYTTDGSTMVPVDSSAFSFAYDTWYWIAVGRTGNTLYFSAGIPGGSASSLGTADLTGIVFYASSNGSFYLGVDSDTFNPFVGHVQEVELFVGENPTHTIPVAARSTAYIPAVDWSSESTFVKTGVAKIEVILFLDEQEFASFGVPTINSEAKFYVSCDNGATWHQVTLVKSGKLTIPTAVYSGSINSTGFLNTNQLKYRVTDVAGKVIKVDGCILYWA